MRHLILSTGLVVLLICGFDVPAQPISAIDDPGPETILRPEVRVLMETRGILDSL